MRNVNDGGPAFPVLHPSGNGIGMSLLDYFAGQVLLTKDLSGLDPRKAVKRAYDVAELMLEERNFRANRDLG